ncbi:molecular chaperone DnaJ [Gleimia hominis]|uniref:Chaperone protein DnaJ n=1 Tax=Gleimia hominis TaxID=595468 RepID=A0ABU3IAR9_9ACTO|nr:molecular chaperone DnaJ [Gleimia hominis]MDT3767477.1 molecular chaperone DnaJ [Gleimia hominis]
MNEDYYEILGVSRTASTEEIKKAYRKLSRKLHPDIAGPEKEEEFKRVSVAYETLSNPQKRQRYDMGGSASGASGFGGFDMGDMFGDIFESFMGGMGANASTGRSRRGQDLLSVMTIDLKTAAFGGTEETTINTAVVCPTCEGSCAKPGTSPRTCSQCHGSGTVRRAQNTLLGTMMTSGPCPACGGHGTIIPEPCDECSGEGRVHAKRTVSVDIPAGVSAGTRIRMSGEGEVGPAGGPAGDLYIEIREEPHDIFTRSGDDLLVTLSIPMTLAVLGTTVPLETLDGTEEIEVKPGSQPGEEIVLKGYGVGHLHRNSRGDIRIRLKVEIPKKLSAQEREAFDAFAALRPEASAKAQEHGKPGGFFQFLREKFAGN